MEANRREAMLIGVIRDMLAESGRPPRKIALDSRLERDLGFDSLSRAELFFRIGRAFNVDLPEESLAAETVKDLLTGLVLVGGGESWQSAAPAKNDEPLLEFPEECETLVEVLDWHASRHPDRTHLVFLSSSFAEERLSFGSLQQKAKAVAASLLQLGVQRNESVAIMLPTSREYFYAFFGVLFAKAVPVPIYPPFRPAGLADHLARYAATLQNAGSRILIANEETIAAATTSRSTVVAVSELLRPAGIPLLPQILPSDTALLQYTSGSTGNPKGVVLTHENLLADIRAMGRAVNAASSDVFVSWLPLYHDMGLIGAWLGSLYHAFLFVVMSPLTFLARPVNWLWAIHRYRATISAAPNFAFSLCLNKIEDSAIAGLDLSSLRLLMNGAEPVSPDILEGFEARYAKYLLRPEAVAPVYGLAECSVGLAFTPIGRGPRIDSVDRETFEREGRAVAATEGRPQLRFVSSGLPLPGHQIRVVDDSGRELAERRQGRLEFRGPAATSGYFRNPIETARLFHGEWLDSGDLAYIAQGEVHITGRMKDIIIRGGRNYHPYELEEAVGNIPGIRRGCVAVFGLAREGTERIVVMAETREKDAGRKSLLAEEIRRRADEILGAFPDEVLLVPPHSVLKTSSGKIRRNDCRAWYESGMPSKRFRRTQRRLLQASGEFFHAAYLWLLFWLIAPAAWLFCVLGRSPAFCWRTSRFFARIFLNASFIPWSASGEDNIPSFGNFIVAANHASYLDGILLIAALPANSSPAGYYSFVAKRELSQSFVAGSFLRHLGSIFVERFDFRQGLEDAKRLEEKCAEGVPLVFFPEGTFSRRPGLAPFRMGAFFTAANAGCKLIPVTLAGTRSVLRDGSWFPRREALSVAIGSPLFPAGSSWQDAVALRDAARREILRRCGEPDLDE